MANPPSLEDSAFLALGALGAAAVLLDALGALSEVLLAWNTCAVMC